MAEIDQPDLVAQIVRQLNVKGSLQPFVIPEVAMAVFDIGRLVGLGSTEVVTPGLSNSILVGLLDLNQVIQVAKPDFDDPEVASSSNAAPVAGTVLVDTGQLGAGRVQFHCVAGHNDAAGRLFDLEWRNAANTANVAVFHYAIHDTSTVELIIRLNIALNERLRWVNRTAVTGEAVSWIASVGAGAAVAS